MHLIVPAAPMRSPAITHRITDSPAGVQPDLHAAILHINRIAGTVLNLRSFVLADIGAVQSGGLDDEFISFGDASDADEAEPEQAAPPTSGLRQAEPLSFST